MAINHECAWINFLPSFIGFIWNSNILHRGKKAPVSYSPLPETACTWVWVGQLHWWPCCWYTGIWLQLKSRNVFLLVRCSIWCCMHSRIVGYSPKCLVSVSEVGSECDFIGFFVRYELSDVWLSWRQFSTSVSLMGNYGLVFSSDIFLLLINRIAIGTLVEKYFALHFKMLCFKVSCRQFSVSRRSFKIAE